jgi:hypothetical protein
MIARPFNFLYCVDAYGDTDVPYGIIVSVCLSVCLSLSIHRLKWSIGDYLILRCDSIHAFTLIHAHLVAAAHSEHTHFIQCLQI